MRIAVSVLGYFSLTLIILGSLFKMQHWPGAGPMLVLGISIFSTFFCLFYLIYCIKERKDNLDMVKAIFISASMSILSIAMMFKVQHWPGAGVMLTFGLSLLAFVCVPLLLVSFAVSKEKTTTLGVIHAGIGVAAISLTFAFNTSHNVLLSYETSYGRTEASIDPLLEVNRSLAETADSSQSAAQRANQDMIHQRSLQLYQLIGDYKKVLIMKTEHLSEDQPAELFAVENLHGKDNYDIPTNILIGGDEGQLREDEWSAAALRVEIENYRDALISVLESPQSQESVSNLLTLKEFSNMHDGTMSWEIAAFYHAPLISVLNTLTTLQQSVLMAEFVALNDATAPR